MVKILDVETIAQSEKITSQFLMNVSGDLLKEQKIDAVYQDHFIVKFEDSDLNEVKAALDQDGRLPELATKLNIPSELAKILVLKYGELNKSVPQEKIERLINSSAAVIRIGFEIKSSEAKTDDIIELQFRVFTDRDLDNVEFHANLSEGLLLVDSPKELSVLPQSDDGYAELLKVRAVGYGQQTAQISLKGIQGGQIKQVAAETALLIHPNPPEIEASLVNPIETVNFGNQFPITFRLKNTGKGSAKEIHITGLESISAFTRIIQTIPSSVEIPSLAIAELPVIFLPIKSGQVKSRELLLEYKDLEGRLYSKNIGTIEFNVVTPQPNPKILITHSSTLTPNSETTISYTLTNSGQGDAKNILLKISLAQGVSLIRGTTSRKILVLKPGQVESGQLDVRIGEASSLVSQAEIDAYDIEDVLHTSILSAKDLGIDAESLLAGPKIIETPKIEVAPVTETPAQVVQPVTVPPATPATPEVPPVVATPPKPPEPKKVEPDFKLLMDQGTIEQWLGILELGNVNIDLSNLLNEAEDYSQPGYRNLLIAIYETKQTKRQLDPILSSEKFTYRCMETLRALKEKSHVEYDVSGSDRQYADDLLNILSPSPEEDALKKKSAKKGAPKPKFYTFQNSKGENVQVKRELLLEGDSSFPTSVGYYIVPMKSEDASKDNS